MLDSTLALIAERGAGAFSTQAIADAAQVSFGTVCRHFPDRVAILAELVNEAVRDITFELVSEVNVAVDRGGGRGQANRRRDPDGRLRETRGDPPGSARLLIFRQPCWFQPDADGRDGTQPAATGQCDPSSMRTNLAPRDLWDLMLLTTGLTPGACQRIALQHPPRSDRDATVRLAARMSAAAPDPGISSLSSGSAR
ncbi:TetR/AcrR family transcriptional regulator [Mycolicibacterium austroafricanum]|nr:TetR/AcrR family transcriptional regulator [Mycolicibacterium austroafricanum]